MAHSLEVFASALHNHVILNEIGQIFSSREASKRQEPECYTEQVPGAAGDLVEAKQIKVVQRVVLNSAAIIKRGIDEKALISEIRDSLKRRYLEALSNAFPEATEISLQLNLRLLSQKGQSMKPLINVYGGIPEDEFKVSEVLDHAYGQFESNELDKLLAG